MVFAIVLLCLTLILSGMFHHYLINENARLLSQNKLLTEMSEAMGKELNELRSPNVSVQH
jgi:hypothetical protein